MYITSNSIHDLNLRKNPRSAKFAVYDFAKKYVFGREIKSLRLTVSADTAYILFVNGKILRGPCSSGGDFLLDTPPAHHFADIFTIHNLGNSLDFFAIVHRGEITGTEHCHGNIAFYLQGDVEFTDGSTSQIDTDDTWLARYDSRYYQGHEYFDGRVNFGEWTNALPCVTTFKDELSILEPLSDEKLYGDITEIEIPPHSEKTVKVSYGKIYSAYLDFDIRCQGLCELNATSYELPGQDTRWEKIAVDEPTEYHSLRMHSVSFTELKIANKSGKPAIIRPSITFTHYPIHERGTFHCDDEKINKIVEVCTHTLDICRQSIHLDSPKHQEPLACTGDYNIEMLMEAFAFGDLTLSKFDIIRTANLLTSQDGRMFHTTYSLIFVGMLYDYYMLTGDIDTVKYCVPGLQQLFRRFESYKVDNGLVEGPDYMFVDWIVVDGYSMHHPPKSLGQTVLNAFYYGALINGVKLAVILGDTEKSNILTSRAKALKEAINRELFDEEKELYFAGLNTPEVHRIYGYMPKNNHKRYYLAHGNVLCALYGIADDKLSESIMRRVMAGEMPDYQPYFAHYVFDALDRTGLYEEYAPALIDRWKKVVEDCDIGLAEGWIKPQEDYRFDHSHAWGGTVLYQLYKHSLGLQILKPGFTRISLRPKNLGFKNVEISIPTPMGELKMSKKEGCDAEFVIPDGITVVSAVDVAAALIWDGDKFMICQRPATKTRPLQWEFVGGKVEPGESISEALIRECHEELDITVEPMDVFTHVYHDYPDIRICLTLFNARISEGIPKALEHNDIKWITPAEIPNYSFCPADKDILELLMKK